MTTPANNWEPIATFTGSPTSAIVCAQDRWLQVGEATYRGEGESGSDGWAWEGYDYRIFPTHWMPLPEPPQ